MNSAIEAASSFNPQNSLPSCSPNAREKPVPTGSINTKSETSSIDSAVSNIGYGAAPGNCASLGTFTRLGPNAPICNHVEAEPGPPFHIKVTGRFLSLLLFFLV